MNDDERFLKDWLEDHAPDSTGALKDADQIMARLPETRQRSRWWPLLPSRRSSPRPSGDGQPPTINGRTRSMFSPVKAITAGALVFALGGAFLIAQPFDQQPSVPGAETEAIAPTWVTGSIELAPLCSGPDTEIVEMDGVFFRHDWNYVCSPQTWTTSDARLTGEVTRRWNADVYETDAGFISVNMTTDHLRNDDGGWVCSYSNLQKGSGLWAEYVTGDTAMCVGEGGYDGLSALLVLDVPAGPLSPENPIPIEGLVFPGDAPPLPEPPAGE